MKAVLILGFLCALQLARAGVAEGREGNELSNSAAGSQLVNRNIRAADPKKDGGNNKKTKKSLKKKAKSTKKKSTKNKKVKKTNNKKAKKNKKKTKKSSKKVKSAGKKKVGKKSNGKKSGAKKSKGKKSGAKKSKGKKSKGKKSGRKSLKSARQTCDLTCVTKAVANYFKWNNNLRQNKRITSFVKMSQSKKAKATDFANSSAILLAYTSNGKDCDGKSPPSGDVSDAITDLPNCTKTAAALCDVNLDAADQAKVDKCKPLLEAFQTGFVKCYQAAAPTCACFNALPAVDADCDNHLAINDKVKGLKDKCISGSEKGSFSACRKHQLNLGPVINKCKPPPTITTKAPAGRFRNLNLFKFKHFNKD